MDETAVDGSGQHANADQGYRDGHHACHAPPPAPSSFRRSGHRSAQSQFGPRHHVLIPDSIFNQG
jgi:hypothetical protein